MYVNDNEIQILAERAKKWIPTNEPKIVTKIPKEYLKNNFAHRETLLWALFYLTFNNTRKILTLEE